MDSDKNKPVLMIQDEAAGIDVAIGDATTKSNGTERVKCPYCDHPEPRVLTATSFPPDKRKEVEKAMLEESTLYECEQCKKRWAVQGQRLLNRKARRRMDSIARLAKKHA